MVTGMGSNNLWDISLISKMVGASVNGDENISLVVQRYSSMYLNNTKRNFYISNKGPLPDRIICNQIYNQNCLL
jgi:hypothetical protein